MIDASVSQVSEPMNHNVCEGASFRSETDIDGAFSVVNMVMRKEGGHSQHGCDDNSDDHSG